MHFRAFYETQHHSAHALSASKAYAEIIEALQNASAAAEKARTNANEAQQVNKTNKNFKLSIAVGQ